MLPQYAVSIPVYKPMENSMYGQHDEINTQEIIQMVKVHEILKIGSRNSNKKILDLVISLSRVE